MNFFPIFCIHSEDKGQKVVVMYSQYPNPTLLKEAIPHEEKIHYLNRDIALSIYEKKNIKILKKLTFKN